MDLNTISPGFTDSDAPQLHRDAHPAPLNTPDARPPQTPLLDSLSKRTSTTPYRKEWNKITGSVHASIFLEQLIWRWRKAGRKTFSKFISPCSHPDYRAGSSWYEELGFSRREFEGAVRAIGTKITAGISKREARQRNILIYWTDKSRRTHWELNPAMLEARLQAITEDSDAHLCTLLMKCPDRTLPNKSTNSTVHKDAPTPALDSTNSRGKNNSRQQQQTPDLEALALEESFDSSTKSLSSSPETRDSEGRRTSAEAPTPPVAGESSGNNSRNLKSKEQKPAPRQGNRKSESSTATPSKALVVNAPELSAAGQAKLAAALARQAEISNKDIARTRRDLLALLKDDEAAWCELLDHSILNANTCVSNFAKTHASRPAGAGKSLAESGVTGITAEGKHETDLGAGYMQFGQLIKDGNRPSRRGGGYVSDIRVSEEGIRYLLLSFERSNDKFGGSFIPDGEDETLHIGLAGLAAERARRARYAEGQTEPEDAYTQFRDRIEDGIRIQGNKRYRDVRIAHEEIGERIFYLLLPGERSDDEFGSETQAYEAGATLHIGLAGLAAERARRAQLEDAPDPKRTAAAKRRREGYEWLFDKETESTA